MATPEIGYDIVLEGTDYSVTVDWGREPGWVERYANALARARRISLVPKVGIAVLPLVTVQLDRNQEAVVFSRIFGTSSGGRQVRVYAVGWKRESARSLLWIYPNGIVEHSDEPTLVKNLL